ncbi:MAG: 1-deoxy-D-xylulose-5-phosphate synthase [Clostridia bacterium]|nr:1-deoxy-D-xylulose-5-phosphate synthase [Clostridia bacterium]
MYKYLSKISCPEDVKKLNTEALTVLAEEIRSFLIESVSKTGGHLASNLGVVELTIALLRSFELPKDKIIWDVGHQSYVYKLLTGRMDKFSTLRQFNGLAGFPKTNESKYDSFNTGHSSTSVSAALGISVAKQIKNEDGLTVAVIGDGALSGGMATEALCNAAGLKKNFIVVLNDNDMSISKSVGGFTKHLTKLRSVPAYFSIKSRLEDKLGKGTTLCLKKIKDLIKHMFVGDNVFDNMGFTYFGPIDGHDIEMVSLMLNRAKLIPGPVLLHVITKKGKGYSFAESQPSVYHGVSTFEASKEIVGMSQGKTYSRTAGDELSKLAEKDKSICAVTAAMTSGTGMDEFSEKFPDRFFDVAIAEQHAVTFSAGLAINGLKPFVMIYSTFLQRAYDQILHDVCLQNLNVTFCIDRAGVVGEDGETHHGLYDISYMSQMPNMTLFAPSNFEELRQMIEYAASGANKGPIAIRYPRGTDEAKLYDNTPFVPGKHSLMRVGEKVCLICAGNMVKTGVEIYEKLTENGVSTSLINLRTVYPLDNDFIVDMANKHQLIVTIEDGAIKGGMGENVASIIASSNMSDNKKIIIKGFGQSVTHGSIPELCKLFKMDSESITEEILKELK